MTSFATRSARIVSRPHVKALGREYQCSTCLARRANGLAVNSRSVVSKLQGTGAAPICSITSDARVSKACGWSRRHRCWLRQAVFLAVIALVVLAAPVVGRRADRCALDRGLWPSRQRPANSLRHHCNALAGRSVLPSGRRSGGSYSRAPFVDVHLECVGLCKIDRAIVTCNLQAAGMVQSIQVLFTCLYSHISNCLGGLLCRAEGFVDLRVKALLSSKPLTSDVDLQ